MQAMILITNALMWLCFFCALCILYSIRNGRTVHLAGVRMCLRFLACVPIFGLILNLVGDAGLMPVADFTILRRLVQYTTLALSLVSFLLWLLRMPGGQHNKP